jgi:hypothetical protein
MSELRVPSSTTWVETIALPSNAQNSAAMMPAWIPVKATSDVDPCSRTEPVVMSWNGRERKYITRKIRNSERPAEGGHIERSKGYQARKITKDAPTAALLRVVTTMRTKTTIMLTPQTIMLAIFPSDPNCPALMMPHSGFTPTGAVAGMAERLTSVLGEWFSSCG